MINCDHEANMKAHKVYLLMKLLIKLNIRSAKIIGVLGDTYLRSAGNGEIELVIFDGGQWHVAATHAI